MQNFGFSGKNRRRNDSKFCISVKFLQNCGDLRDSGLRAPRARCRILTSAPENAMTRATEFCDQHGLMLRRPLLKGPGPKGFAGRTKDFLEIVGQSQFAFRRTFTKQREFESSESIVSPPKPDHSRSDGRAAGGRGKQCSARFRIPAEPRNAGRPDSAGTGGVRPVNEWTAPSENEIAIPMPAP